MLTHWGKVGGAPIDSRELNIFCGLAFSLWPRTSFAHPFQQYQDLKWKQRPFQNVGISTKKGLRMIWTISFWKSPVLLDYSGCKKEKILRLIFIRPFWVVHPPWDKTCDQVSGKPDWPGWGLKSNSKIIKSHPALTLFQTTESKDTWFKKTTTWYFYQGREIWDWAAISNRYQLVW